MRLRIDLAYDGSDFSGWAVQPGLRTVEGELSTALATVLRSPPVALMCAGRTDAGVHARGQVVHADVTVEVDVDVLRRRLNGFLTSDVRVRQVTVAPVGFDARFSALWRRYAYRIADTPEAVDPLTRAHVLRRARPVDLDAMNEAAVSLLGQHDFASFCQRRVGATTIRTLQDFSWHREASGLAVATVRADAFCRSMVRSLVGCLLAVGEGRRPTGWVGEVLRAGARNPAVIVAPAHGLTLEEVAYPRDCDVAARAGETRARRDG